MVLVVQPIDVFRTNIFLRKNLVRKIVPGQLYLSHLVISIYSSTTNPKGESKWTATIPV